MPKGFDHNNATEGDALTPEHFDRAGAAARIRNEYWDKLPFKPVVTGYDPDEPTEYEENGPCYSEEEDFETYDR